MHHRTEFLSGILEQFKYTGNILLPDAFETSTVNIETLTKTN